jgi:hypothetical protein
VAQSISLGWYEAILGSYLGTRVRVYMSAPLQLFTVYSRYESSPVLAASPLAR